MSELIGSSNKGALTSDQFNDVIFFLKLVGMNMIIDGGDSVKLFNWVSEIDNTTTSIEKSLNSALNKLSTTFGPAYASRTESTLQTKFSNLITDINKKITDSGEGTEFSPSSVDMLDLLHWMVDNAGGGSGSTGSGFTDDEIDLINNYKTKITSKQLCNPSIDDSLDSAVAIFIKLLGIIWDDFLTYTEQNDIDITFINNKISTIEDNISTNATNISNNATNISNNATDITDLDVKISNNEFTINTTILPKINITESKVNDLETNILEISNLNKNTLSTLEEIQNIEDTLIYSLNELRNFGESYNIITLDSNVDIYPTVKWNLYIDENKFMFDQYAYGYEGISLPNKLPYTLSHINSYLFFMDFEVYDSLLKNIKTEFENNNLGYIRNFLYKYFPAYFYRTDFYYNDNKSDNSYGMITKTETNKLLKLTDLLHFINSTSTSGLTLKTQLDDTIPEFTDRTDLFILDDSGIQTFTRPITLNITEDIKIGNMFIKDNDTTTNTNLLFFKHPDKIQFKYKLYVVTSVDTEIENGSFDYIPSTTSTSSYYQLDLNNFNFDPDKTYKFVVEVYYNKILLKTQIINVDSGTSGTPSGTAPTVTFTKETRSGISLTTTTPVTYTIGSVTDTSPTVICTIIKDPGESVETEVFSGTATITSTNDIEVSLDPTWGDGSYKIRLDASNAHGSDYTETITGISFGGSGTPSGTAPTVTFTTEISSGSVNLTTTTPVTYTIGSVTGTSPTVTCIITKDPTGTSPTEVFNGAATITATNDIEVSLDPTWGNNNYRIELQASNSHGSDNKQTDVNISFDVSTDVQLNSISTVDFSTMPSTDLTIGKLIGTYDNMTQKIIKDPSGANTLIYDGSITPLSNGDIEIIMQPSWGDGSYNIEITATDSATGNTDTETITFDVIFNTSSSSPTYIDSSMSTTSSSPTIVSLTTSDDELMIGTLEGTGGTIHYEIHDATPTLKDSGITYETPDGEIEIPIDSAWGDGVYEIKLDIKDASGASITTETIFIDVTF
jgi:hypothetical protein